MKKKMKKMNKIIIIIVLIIVFIYNCSKKEEITKTDEMLIKKEPANDLTKYKVKSKILKLRRGPGKNFEEITTLNKNDEVIYIEKVETKDEGIWYLIQKKIDNDTDKYIEGFAYSLFLEKIEEGDKK